MRLRRPGGGTSTGVNIAVAGIAIAIVVMELSIAIAVGFKHQIEQKILGFDAPITILPPYDYDTGQYASTMPHDTALVGLIAEIAHEARPIEIIRRQAVLKTDSDFIAVECRAFGAGHDDAFERAAIVRGHQSSAGDSIIISATIARQLGIDTAARPYLYFFVDGRPKTRRATVSGIYDSGFSDYDRSIIYTPLEMLATLSADSASFTGIALEGITFENVGQIAAQADVVRHRLADGYRQGRISAVYPVTSVANTGAAFFSWLDLLDTNVVVIFILMGCVAAFTLVSSLFIIILDRIPTIGILRTLGASRAQVSAIFRQAALRIVGLGALIGNAVGVGLVFLQRTTGIIPLDPEMYYLDSVPVELSITAIIILNIAAVVGAWLILILPARLAATVDPAQTTRYE